jgi:transcriptional regulator with XRE-family HTH domain
MFSPSNAEVLGAAIRAGRSALNWSQADLAERAGVSMPTVARIEATLISPKMHTLGKLFLALEQGGVTFSWGNEAGVNFVMTVRLNR